MLAEDAQHKQGQLNACLTRPSSDSQAELPLVPNFEEDTIRPATMKRPPIGMNVLVFHDSAASLNPPSTSTTVSSAISPCSIVDNYAHESPTTSLEDATLRYADSLQPCHGNYLSSTLGSSPSAYSFSTIGPHSRTSATEGLPSPASIGPAASPISCSNSPVPPLTPSQMYATHRNALNRSGSVPSLSDTDYQDSSSSQATPALTRGSSASGSSRPSSFFRSSIYSHSTNCTSPSLDSIGKSPFHFDSSPAPSPAATHASSLKPSYLDFNAEALLSVMTKQEELSPVSPSRIGLGITTPVETCGPSVAGRSKSVNRSRSSSVAERIERVRVSAIGGTIPGGSEHVLSPFFTSTQNVTKSKAIGLTAKVTEETTHWILKDARPMVHVLYAISSMPTFSRLTMLDISNCGLTALPSQLVHMMALQELDVSQNPLAHRTLPPFLAYLRSLQTLVADSCDLASLQYSLSTLCRLRTLSVRHNRLKSLPSWLCHLEPSLLSVCIDGNAFQGQWAEVLRPLLVATALESPDCVSELETIQDGSFSLPSPPSRALSTSAATVFSLPNSASNSPRNSQMHPTSRPGTSLENHPRPRASSRTTTMSQGWRNDASSNIKRMKSAGDLRPSLAHASENSRALSNSPEVMINEIVRPTSATSESEGHGVIKKKGSFFKKMTSFRSRKDSERPSTTRPHLLQEGDRSVSAPVMPVKQIEQDLASDTPKSTARARKDSSASALDLPSLSRASSVTSFASRSPFTLTSVPPLPSSGFESSLSLDEETSENELSGQIEDAMLATEDPYSALRSVLAFLRDLDDLSSSDTSADAVFASLKDAQISQSSLPGSRALSMHSTSSHLEGDSYLADSDTARMPHSSTSTSATREQHSGQLKLKSDPAKRERVINEIVATERSYVKGLEELFEIYVSPASQAVSKSSASSSNVRETIIPLAERKIVFSNAENLMQFHKTAFLPDLEAVVANLSRQRSSAASDSSTLSSTLSEAAEELARVFLRHGAFLKMYTIYVNNFDSALARFQSWNKTPATPLLPPASAATRLVPTGTVTAAAANSHHDATATSPMSSQQKKRVRAFMKQAREHPSHSQMNCESYLLMPVQRIPRYKMLLESLLCCTPAREGSGLDPSPIINAALDLATNLASDLNEKKRESEGRQRLLYWQNRIGNKFRSPLVQPHRMLIKESRMVLERVVKRSSEFVNTESLAEEPSLVQVHSLKVDTKAKPVIALLTSDILVLIHEPADHSVPAELFTVIRLGQSLKRNSCASVFGSESTLRLVDSRAIVYLRLMSSFDAQSWAVAVNSQISAF